MNRKLGNKKDAVKKVKKASLKRELPKKLKAVVSIKDDGFLGGYRYVLHAGKIEVTTRTSYVSLTGARKGIQRVIDRLKLEEIMDIKWDCFDD